VGESGRQQPVVAGGVELVGVLEHVLSDGRRIAVVAQQWITGQLLDRRQGGVRAVDHCRRHRWVELDDQIGPQLEK